MIDPVSPADAVRARVPAALAAYAETRATVLEDGIVASGLKRLCARYLAEDHDVVAHADDPARFDERERAALRLTLDMTRQVAVRCEIIERARCLFGERQLVELMGTIAGYNMVSRFLVVLGIDAAGE